MAEKDVQSGKLAPDFDLPDADDGRFHLNDELAKGPLILLFYPSDFGIVCSLEMKTFHRMREEFDSKDIAIVGISRNSIITHKQWMESMHFHIRLLSDEEGSVCEMYAGLQDSGLLKGHPRRAVYILDRFGIIRYAWISRAEGLTPPFEEIREKSLSLDL